MRQNQLKPTTLRSLINKPIPKYWVFIPVLIFVVILGILISKLTEPKSSLIVSQPTNSVVIVTSAPVNSSSSTTQTSSVSSTTSASSSIPATATSTSSKAVDTSIKCSDCWLAPVDKTYSLPSSYAPAVVATELPGTTNNWRVTTATRTDLKALFADALAQGIQMEVASAYRSYKDQETAFNYWVNQEMNAGYDKATAIQRANVYSAKPGHSEHQLGTTVDLRAKNNEAFTDTPGNKVLYDFVLANAHKYGFVISYPQGKENLTGYKYEPWHIRYIGKKLATELFENNYLQPTSQSYLAKFLRDKGY